MTYEISGYTNMKERENLYRSIGSGMVIDTPEGIELYRIVATQKALKLEVEHGLKLSRNRSAFAVAKDILARYGMIPEGESVGTKKKALRLITELIELLTAEEDG